jgi:hypothetical protein
MRPAPSATRRPRRDLLIGFTTCWLADDSTITMINGLHVAPA